MALPNITTALTILDKAQADINALIDKLEAISPDALKGDEEALKVAINSVLSGINLADVQSSVNGAFVVIKNFKGALGTGFEADLA